MKRVVVLGSTGSIGTQTLDVIEQHPDQLKVVGLAAGFNSKKLAEQSQRFPEAQLALYEDPAGSGIPAGIDAISDLAAMDGADIVVVSVAGVIGLIPAIRAIEAGKHIALASKEVLVAAGEIVMPLLKRHSATMAPIDSEHSAIFQCMQGHRSGQIEELILTASGGPFLGRTLEELKSVTVEQALNHPTWRMGGKITVDSATLMNKGLETIEAKWLFEVGIEQVKVVVHRQSVIHSMLKLQDGSVLAQMGWPDMRLPIQYALLHPERVPNNLKPWQPLETPNLTFEPVDEETFRSLELARESCRIGGTMPCAMNAANEEAANAFLRREIGFLDIPRVVEETMANHLTSDATLENILEADAGARLFAKSLMREQA
ncbi:MAG: 1-deoxy-D-xylulose-5-phosphate reductoisomerase [Fimbriimonadaceae bacterium]